MSSAHRRRPHVPRIPPVEDPDTSLLMHTVPEPEIFLQQLFDTAVASADPGQCLAEHLPRLASGGHTLVVGAGKGSAAMAAAVEQAWSTELSGIVITPYGHGCACRHIEIIEAAHPEPLIM